MTFYNSDSYVKVKWKCQIIQEPVDFKKKTTTSVCNLCNQAIKHPQSSTTLMQRHLKKYHKAEYKTQFNPVKDARNLIYENLLPRKML